MREVFVDKDHARVGFYQSVLEEAGIPNMIRNEYCTQSVSEVLSPAMWPALCVTEDQDYDRAMQLLGEIYYAPRSGSARPAGK